MCNVESARVSSPSEWSGRSKQEKDAYTTASCGGSAPIARIHRTASACVMLASGWARAISATISRGVDDDDDDDDDDDEERASMYWSSSTVQSRGPRRARRDSSFCSFERRMPSSERSTTGDGPLEAS
jgi:hypothetical protein